MINVIQAVQSIQSVQAITPLPTLGRISHVAQVANSSFSIPSVILNLGTVSPAPLTYNAAGLFESLSRTTGTSSGASVSMITHVDTSNIARTATAAATAYSGTNTVANLAALLGYGTTASSTDVLSSLVTSQTLPTTIGQALTTLLANEFNPSATIGTDMLTVNKALTHLLSNDLNIAKTGLDTASAVGIFGTPDLLQGMSSDLTAQTDINNLLSDLGLAAGESAATQQSLSTQLVANMTQAAAPLGSSGTNATTTAIGSDGTETPTVTTTAETIAAKSASSTSVGRATITSLSTMNTAAVVPETSVAVRSNETTKVASTLTSSAVTRDASDTTEAASSAVASQFLEDAAAQAMTNIASNPSYANMAAALSMNAAIFRSQHAVNVSQPNTSRDIQPVTPVPRINAVSLSPP